MSDRCQNPDLIDSVMYLSAGKVDKLDFFKSVNRLIDESFDFIYTGVGSLPEFGNDLKILEGHLRFL